jgi:tRNA pseudouridine55 synthase
MSASSQPSRPTPCGVINVNKPGGWTSRDVVNRVSRLVGTARVGHAGTLDPLATGVLLVCVGKATRLIDFAQQMEKQYRGTFLLGRTSTTEDVEGEVTLLAGAAEPSAADIAAAAASFIGETLQRPPAFSALKVAGRRAYDLARAGRPVVLVPRKIFVRAIEVVAYDYPELTLDITCGSGTYVRSLGRDLAERLGAGAVMSALARTRIGAFAVSDAHDLTQLRPEGIRDWLSSPRKLTSALPTVELSIDQAFEISNGRYITLTTAELRGAHDIAAIGPDGELHSILQRRGADQYGARLNLCEVPGS